MAKISNNELIDRIRLIRSERIGPIAWRHLMQLYGTATAALMALPSLAKRGGTPLFICSRENAIREIDACQAIGANIISLGEADYPPLLAQIEDAPPIITIKGDLALTKKPTIAMVGTRKASMAGLRIAQNIACELGQAGIVVVSGLARGIDKMVHQSTLTSGTIAVIASGINITYPPENKELQQQISEIGLVVTEMPFDVSPQARHFPSRNRIISGLSLATIVVEAARNSGSLITARFTLEQGRELMAVPGSPLEPRSEGTNSLLQQGAHIIANGADALNIIRSLMTTSLAEPEQHIYNRIAIPIRIDIDDCCNKMLELLSPVPTEVSELIRISGFSTSTVLITLLELELAGRLNRHPGNLVSI